MALLIKHCITILITLIALYYGHYIILNVCILIYYLLCFLQPGPHLLKCNHRTSKHRLKFQPLVDVNS